MTVTGPIAPRTDAMDEVDMGKLHDDFVEVASRSRELTAVIGYTRITGLLLRRLDQATRDRIDGIFDTSRHAGRTIYSIPVLPFERLGDKTYGTIVVAANRDKEQLLHAASPYVKGRPKILVSGYGHYDFQDRAFHELMGGLTVPSLANGYPNTRPHLYQCLQNAARLNLEGAVAEFGAFQGGTTMFLARTIKSLHKGWRVFAFDTFKGFPERRHPWDMYDHADLFHNDVRAVRRYLADENVEVVEGDIVETTSRLRGQPMVLSFIDTDNYSPAKAALDVVQDSTVVGGAIVFDHFTGENRFRYTLGERLAAKRLLDDPRYFNLHGTGVFLRQR